MLFLGLLKTHKNHYRLLRSNTPRFHTNRPFWIPNKSKIIPQYLKNHQEPVNDLESSNLGFFPSSILLKKLSAFLFFFCCLISFIDFVSFWWIIHESFRIRRFVRIKKSFVCDVEKMDFEYFKEKKFDEFFFGENWKVFYYFSFVKHVWLWIYFCFEKMECEASSLIRLLVSIGSSLFSI